MADNKIFYPNLTPQDEGEAKKFYSLNENNQMLTISKGKSELKSTSIYEKLVIVSSREYHSNEYDFLLTKDGKFIFDDY
jgi:hypothetical protein